MQTERGDRNKSALIGSLTILVCLSAFTVDVCIPAFPELGRALNVSSGTTHLVLSAYLLSLGLAQIPLGYLSDRIGRVKTIYFGLFLFILGGGIIAASPSFELLLLGRFVQGAGGAVGPVMARAIARDITTGAELNRVMSLLISALGVSTLIAPVIGSILLTFLAWKSCFAISLVFGFFCLFLVGRYIPETRNTRMRQEENLLQHCLRFAREPRARLGTAVLGLLFFGYLGYVAGFSTILVDQFHISPSLVGWIFAFFTGFYLYGAWVCRRLAQRTDEWGALDYGCLSMVASLPFFITMYIDVDLALAGAGGLIFFSIGMGLIFGSAITLVMNNLPEMAGTASGLMGTLQTLCGALGSFVSFLLYQGNALGTLQILIGSLLLLVLLYLYGRQTIPR